MSYSLILALTFAVFSCGTENRFSTADKATETPLASALRQSEKGDKAGAFATIVESLPAEQQAFLTTADPKSPTFVQDLQATFANATTEDKEKYSALSTVMIENQGVSLASFAATLAGVSGDGASLALTAASAVDPDIKRLFEAVASVTDPNSIGIAVYMGMIAGFNFHIIVLRDEITVVQFYSDTYPELHTITNSAFAAMINFAVIMRSIDSNGDYKITAEEAAAYFDTDGYEKARGIYDMLNIAVYTLMAFKADREKTGHKVADMDKAIEKFQAFQSKLTDFKRTANGSQEQVSTCSDAARSKEATTDCVKQWAVAITNKT